MISEKRPNLPYNINNVENGAVKNALQELEEGGNAFVCNEVIHEHIEHPCI